MATKDKEEIKEANLNKSPDQFIYDNIEIKWGVPENYEILTKLGRGRYSEVFEAIYKQIDPYCLKILKPIKTKKIKREIKILQLLNECPNIVHLKDILRDPSTKSISLVFDFVEHIFYRNIYPQLNQADIKLYMYQILKALNFAHNKGIMHRDIKPNNILICPKQKKAVIIDWGLSDFYFPDNEYSTKVGSRFYKAPELLVNFKKYTYSVDIWAAGCVFAEMLFQMYPLFPGSDGKDQLEKITRLLGTNELFTYLEKYHIQLDKSFETVLSKHKKSGFSFLVSKEIATQCGNEAIDLLAKMIVYDHEQRISAKEALAHPYFAEMVDMEQMEKQQDVQQVQQSKDGKNQEKSKKNKKKNK